VTLYDGRSTDFAPISNVELPAESELPYAQSDRLEAGPPVQDIWNDNLSHNENNFIERNNMKK